MAPANLPCAFDFLLPVKQWGACRTERELADSPIDMLIDHTDSTYMSGNSVYERQVLQCVVLHQFTYGQARPDSNSLREREREKERGLQPKNADETFVSITMTRGGGFTSSA